MKLVDDQGKKESFDDLTEFVRIIKSPITTLSGNLDELNDDYNTVLELSVKQLETTSSCLCSPCNAACQRLVKVYRHMRKLEQEVKEFQVKFLNAIMLSKAIAEKYDKTVGVENQDEEYEDRLIIAMDQPGRTLDMKAAVDQMRSYLIVGKGMWNSLKGKWLDYVHLDSEFTGKSKQLNNLQNKKKTRARKKDILDSSKIGSEVLTENSLAKIIKAEEDIISRIETENDSAGLQQEGIESSSMVDETTNSDSAFEYENDDVLGISLPSDNEDSIKLESDIVGCGQLNEEKPNIQSNASSVDKSGASDELSPHEEIRATTHSLVKRKKAYYGPVGIAHPFSFVHKPPGQPISKMALSYRRRRAQYPNLSNKEYLLQRKNFPAGKARLPIEELKSSSNPNKRYIRWRESHGKTMSQPAYQKMRRELALQRQKILDEGGTFMPTVNDSVVPVRFVEKDGKLTYLGVEVKKHEDGSYSCALCPDWNFPPCKNRKSMSYHIKKYHIKVAKNFACKKCDAKFMRPCELTLHEKEKHEFGYQCEVCGQTLAHRSALFQHVRIKHNKIKPHVCEHCGKAFGTKKDMTIHVRRHTGERPFVCHVCADTFIEKQSMKKHIRTKHPGEPTDEIDTKPRNFASKSSAEKTSSSEETSQKSNLNSCS